MAIEIERKFLVKNNNFKEQAFTKQKISQGFLSSVPERTVRVRILGELAFITIKGLGNASGASRFEWEKEIEVKEALDLLKICEPGTIHKTRFYVQSNHHVLEVDEFYDDNEGLIIAEIELTDEDEQFQKPAWLGKEVTGVSKYYNSALIQNPFKDW